MRFCPFCAAENADDATHCTACAKKLPRAPSAGLPVDDPPAGDTAPAFPPPPPPLPAALVDPTPTHRVEPLAAIAARPRELSPFPEAPDSGLFGDAKYVISLMRARWERRSAAKTVDGDIQKDVAALDRLLGELGRAGRAHGLTGRPFGEENAAIDAAEARAANAERTIADAQGRLAEEDARFASTEKDLDAKLVSTEETAKSARTALDRLEEERKTLREQKKQVEAKQKQLQKSAEEREAKVAKLPMGDERNALRTSAEELRSDAARLEPDRVELEKKLAALDAPIAEATAKDEAARADLEATRKAKTDARAGHRHRRAELEAEAARQQRARSDATSEATRRLVTLGTLLNLNRIAAPDLEPLYAKADALRASISAREKEIENLRAENSRADPRAVARGTGVLFGVLVLLITVICVLLSLRSRS